MCNKALEVVSLFINKQPDLELTDCEVNAFLVSQLILSIYFRDFVTRIICTWSTFVFTIKWLTICSKFTPITSNEIRPVAATAIYIFASSIWREVEGASQVKQEGTTVCLVPARWIPALTGVASDAISLLNLKQGDCSFLIVTSWVEIFVVPAMKVSTVKKNWSHWLVPEQLQQESAHFIADLASRVRQEGFYHCCHNVYRRR